MRFFLLALTWAVAQATSTPATSDTVRDYTDSFDWWLRTQQLIRTRIAQHEYRSNRPHDPVALKSVEKEIEQLHFKSVDQYAKTKEAYTKMVTSATIGSPVPDMTLYTLPICDECHECMSNSTFYNTYSDCQTEDQINCFALGC
tara:strand:+ start:135 stop:566 length:432 start_codon:yes stop_codon:yes gene_type:complete